jgi:hypothetical protein
LLVTAGAVNNTVVPIVLLSDPLSVDQVIVPPATSLFPDITTAVNTKVEPDSAALLDDEI